MRMQCSTQDSGDNSDKALNPLRFITATSIFDGHDVAINIVRRILQEQGAEVVHLGHNRSVEDIVRAALQEDVDGIAISSYQGGHVEFFRYLVDSLKLAEAGYIRVFGGGGGTITPSEVSELEAYGVEKIYTPEDGRRIGLAGMGQDVLLRTARATLERPVPSKVRLSDDRAHGQCLSLIETGHAQADQWSTLASPAPVIGITGTGGAGKSSVIDELLHYFLQNFPDLHIAVLAFDPTRHKSGGALLGDRIRLNSLDNPRVYMRSMATRRKDWSTNVTMAECISFLKTQGFGLVLVETAGTGQADIGIVDQVDLSLYVMTSDYGAPSQLEKIQMLDYADFVTLNKFDKRGGEDALRDVRHQWRRNHHAFELTEQQLPIFPTMASYWCDTGLHHLFNAICQRLGQMDRNGSTAWSSIELSEPLMSEERILIPSNRINYLAEISLRGRESRQELEQQSRNAAQAHALYRTLQTLEDKELPPAVHEFSNAQLDDETNPTLHTLRQHYQQTLISMSDEARELLDHWQQIKQDVETKQHHYTVRQQTFSGDNYHKSLSELAIPKVAVPHYEDWGELLHFLMQENLPGHYPFTAGVFPYRRDGEDPARMFAGEGTPERTNRRFHYLAYGQKAKRLSTAFDPITLYGEDADARPDIHSRIGMSGVSITSLDDMKKLYSGFDLCAPDTSVSMTINGPAPILLAWFLNTAIDQQVEKYLGESDQLSQAEKTIAVLSKGQPRPRYQGDLPKGNNGLGLALLGVSGDQLVNTETYQRIRRETLSVIRGTLQADILKEDQAQNECIFPLEFGLRLMGDIQEYFITNQVHNYYSVSVSGYHIAEAGANPVTQLAFTLANGFTLVEYYLARGMKIDDFAPQMSFFFSNGMDPEYAVIGRVARRIWARAMREIYRANERSQKLKYHIQTSGRTLHAQTLGFNDIRTTLQALYALYDNCNSLHTNAFDEALTTPTEESVRGALAIQLIINRELGLNFNENPLQGSFIIEQLTDLVEAAVYAEFDRLSERGGVFGAMETLYQRGKIQDESMTYEQAKHDGRMPIVGVNTFLNNEDNQASIAIDKLIRSDESEKQAQINAVATFKALHQNKAEKVVQDLQNAVKNSNNTFAVLMEVSKHCTLGEITHALYNMVGRYRRRV